MRKRYLIPLAAIPLLVSSADAAQKVCVDLSVAYGFSDGHSGAPITGNWASLNFATDANNNLIGGTGALWICTDSGASSPASCSTIDVNLTTDSKVAHGFWVTSDVVPGWGWTTTTTAATKTKPATSTTVIGGKNGVIARFSLDDDSDLVIAKLVDLSGMLGYPTLCGQLWNVLGATAGLPVCNQDSDCQIFAAGDTCTGSFCVPPPLVIPAPANPYPASANWLVPFFGGGSTQATANYWGNVSNPGGSGPYCNTDADCLPYWATANCGNSAKNAPVCSGAGATYSPSADGDSFFKIFCANAAIAGAPFFTANGSTQIAGTCGFLFCTPGNQEESWYNDPNNVVTAACSSAGY